MDGIGAAVAYLVAVLAAAAVLGALTYALVWEWTAIRRTLERHRRPSAEELFWSDHRAVRVPERRQ